MDYEETFWQNEVMNSFISQWTVVKRKNLNQTSICCDPHLPLNQNQFALVHLNTVLSGSCQVGCSEDLGEPALVDNSNCGSSLSQCLLSVHVIPDCVHDAETRSLWGPDHLLQDSWFSWSLRTGLYDSGCGFGLVVLNQGRSDAPDGTDDDG